VKSSSKYSLEEKQEILANLKEMNNDAKEYSSAHGHHKTHLKEDLHERMTQLKREMHEDNKPSREMEEEAAATKVHAIHEDIKAVKAELKTKKLSHADKVEARNIMRQLESQYSQLSHETTKQGRKEVAVSMKQSVQQLKKYLADPKQTLQAKKDSIMSHIVSAEEDYANQDIPSAIKSKIHSKFEEMKESLEEEGIETHELKQNLKSELEEVKSLASKAEKVQKIHSDVSAVKDELASKHLSSSEKSSIRAQLEQIESSAEKYASTTSSSEKSRLKEKMENSLQEIKSKMTASSDDDLEEDAVEEENHNDFEEDKEEKEESDF